MMECVDSLTIDDVTGQAVPEPGTGRTNICTMVAVSSPITLHTCTLCYELLCHRVLIAGNVDRCCGYFPRSPVLINWNGQFRSCRRVR